MGNKEQKEINIKIMEDVIVVEEKEDFRKIKENTYIDCDVVMAEYVDKVVCSNGKVYGIK